MDGDNTGMPMGDEGQTDGGQTGDEGQTQEPPMPAPAPEGDDMPQE